jgi:transcriptional regulator with XRE-family HTH domain
MSKQRIDPIDVTVGLRIRQARIERGLSQEQVARTLGLTFQQVQKYEKGVNRCAPSRLLAIASLTHKAVQWFYGDHASNGTASESSAAERVLATVEGKRLNTAFARIEDPAVRKALVNMAESVAPK